MKEKKEKITGLKDLQQELQKLEARRVALESGISDDFKVILQDLKPSTLIKNTFREVGSSSDLGKMVVRLALGLGVGYFSKRLITRKSAGMWGKAIGAALQYGMMALVARKSGHKLPR